VIRRHLASVPPRIDSRVILDIGSTDATRAIVHDERKRLSRRASPRPRRDFGENRR
jgi:hypothetical protein